MIYGLEKAENNKDTWDEYSQTEAEFEGNLTTKHVTLGD